MAIKDWKKGKTMGSPNNVGIWSNKNGTETTIDIEKETDGYSVNFWFGRDIMTGVDHSKKFKTRIEAFRYARNYMRKN